MKGRKRQHDPNQKRFLIVYRETFWNFRALKARLEKEFARELNTSLVIDAMISVCEDYFDALKLDVLNRLNQAGKQKNGTS